MAYRGCAGRVNSNPHDATIQIAIDVSQKEAFLARFRLWFCVITLGTLDDLPSGWLSDRAPGYSAGGRDGGNRQAD